MFRRMTVGKRLFAGFSFVAVVGAIVAALGIYNMGRISELAARMYTHELQGLSYIKEANVALVEVGRARGNFLLATSEDERSKHRASIAKSLDANKANLASAQPLFVTAKAKQLFAQFATIQTEYEQLLNQTMSLAAAEPLQQRSAELSKAMSETRARADALDDILDQLSAQKEGRAKAAAEDTAAIYAHSRSLMVALVLGSVCAGLAMGAFITRNLTRQLGGEPDYASAIAGHIAAGNLAVPIALRANDNASLLFAMRGMRDRLVTIVAEVRAGTDTIVTASSQIASGNLDLSSRTEEQASSLEETASSMEQITSTVRQNADHAREANRLAAAASEVATRGGAVVGQVVQTMDSINASSKKIVDIISVIDGIAFQTNILALNAAVEAARAGEQGRGFAVVAGEVRNLAQRSAGAAKEIKALIGSSVIQIDLGARLVGEAGHTINEVVASVKSLTEIMGQIGLASNEQSEGIEQINQAMVQMDQVTQQNAALVEQAAAAAASMQEQAEKLTSVVSVFKLGGEPRLAQGATAQLRPALPGRHLPGPVEQEFSYIG